MNEHKMFLFYFFRELGVAWWIRNNNTLRKLIEKVAKASFQTTQDPLDAAIFYLAMKKKSLCWGLYRSIKDEKMATFFKNNFSEDRWRKAALKNAFALLGKVIIVRNMPYFCCFAITYIFSRYPKVASCRLFRLVAHFWIFRLLMKGKLDAYVL